MPPPLLSQSSKVETEKVQCSKIVPSEEEQSEKSGEDNHTTSSPSSQDTVKKRSAFEDLTNGSQSQIVQSKKEDNTELRSHVSKRTSKEMSEITHTKTSKSGLVTSLSNMERQFILDIPTKSKTLTTKEPSVFQKILVFNEESATEETSLMKKTLQSCACHQETFLMGEPLTLLEKTEDNNEFDIEPMTSKRKDKPKEADITEKMIDLKKPVTRKATLTSSPLSLKNKYAIPEEKHTIRGKSSFKKKLLALKMVTSRDKSVIRKPFFKKKNPTTDMKSFLQEPSLLQEKHNAQEEASIFKKPWVLQENTNNEDDTLTEPVGFKGKHTTTEAVHTKKLPSFKPVTYEHEPLSFKKSTTKKDAHFQGPSALPDKHIAHVEVSTVEKSLALKKPTTEEGVLHFHIAPALKKWHSIEEAPRMKKHSPLKKQQGLTKRRHLLNNPAAQEPVTSEPLTFKKSTTEKEPPFQGPSALQKRHTSPGVLSKLKKLHAPQKRPIEEEPHFPFASAFKKRRIMEEPASTQKPLTLEMQQTVTQGTMFHFKNPLVLQTATSGAEPLTKEPLPFKEENTDLLKKKCAPHIIPLWPAQSEWLEKFNDPKNLFSKKPGSLRNETVTRFQENPASLNEKYSIPQKLPTPMPSASEEKTTSQESGTLNGNKLLLCPELFLPGSSADEDPFKFQKSLNLQEKTDRENDSLKTLLNSPDSVSEEEFFYKDRYPCSEESSQERPLALEQEFVFKNVLEENSSGGIDESSHHLLHLHKYFSTKEEASEDPLNIQEELSIDKMAALLEPLNTQDNSMKEAFLKKSTDTEAHSKKCLTLQETTSIKEEATLKGPLASQEKPGAELVTVLKELLVIVKKPNVENVVLTSQEKAPSNAEVFLNEVLELVEKPKIGTESTLEKPLVLQENPSTKTEASLKEPLALKENPSIEKAILQESWTFDHKPDIEKDDGTRKTLTVEKESTEMLALNEGLTAADQLFFTDMPALEETTVIDEEAFFKSFLVSHHENNPCVSSNALESQTDNSSAIVPGIERFSPVMNSSPYESDSNDLQSAVGGRQPEIIILEDSDTVESIEKEDEDLTRNTIYTKEIFIYLRQREEKFIVTKYMDRQMELTSDMRAILVDWLVEVQTSFQMNNETLYLTVKLVDHYLMKAQCQKDHLQLLGSTAYMIAAKLEESYPPSLPEFLYICEDLYQQRDMVSLEMNILKTLNFDINIPTAYNFLRRYASCIHASMKTLTLSRFICEMTLQEYEYVQERPSKLAAACFLLAIYMRNLNNCIPLLEHYTDYKAAELHTLVRKLNESLLFIPRSCLKNVYEKYSEEIFFEVSKIPPLDKDHLEEIFKGALLS
ncbi:G2/mitotic-specific cyclin-B3 isoform X1 [Peromyscus eremicus]|uniref:G2/mitotic-specific cyclin-B3 isoform X1 n=1 Tax=Peromyscus eremicus TaxID=42410 RepID=UPI0027DE6EA4|nr:G2/mitotic-specific cyclin-B3 isoform X1 [Peromyscus eremicus]XP_059106580.1 G2/mitotic-specific cyclin-B3 isoform X1 [Peromyscus eremicus]